MNIIMLKDMKHKPGRIVVVLLVTLVVCYFLIGLYNALWGSGVVYDSSGISVSDGDVSLLMENSIDEASPSKAVEKEALIESQKAGSDDKVLTEKKVIKSGSLAMKVNNLQEGRKNIEDLVEQELGTVASLKESGTDNDRVLSATIKVPAERFDAVMQALRGMAVEIEDVYTYSDDVTEQYLDTAARLSNEEAYEAELVALLGDAADVDDVLAIRTELNAVRAKIESLTASINYYDRNTDMSSITVTMTLYEGEFDVATEKWSPLGVAKSAVDALLWALKGIANVLIWLVVFSPLVLLIKWLKISIMKKKMKMHKEMKE